MADYRGCIPTLECIVRQSSHISPETRVREVVEMFHNDQSLLAAPVVCGSSFIGFITRKELFFKWLSNKFALDLLGREPIRNLLDENLLVMEPELDVNSAFTRFLAADPGLEADCFPVAHDNRFYGIISVSDLMMEISKTQVMLLDDLSRMSSRICDEVAQARKIQQALLPLSTFRFMGITIDAGLTTSSEVGGDFYDYFTVGEDELGLIIADVSGHGVQAGMVTTAAKASLHTLISLGITTPSALLSGMNKAITTTACQTLLMTCLIALIDVKTKRVSIANAGHNFPYLHDTLSGELEHLEILSGFPLGFDAESEYGEFHFPFQQGDSLILYTDGIIECTNSEDEIFGYDRMERLILEHKNAQPGLLRSCLIKHAMEFNVSEEFEDDVTLMIASFGDASA